MRTCKPACGAAEGLINCVARQGDCAYYHGVKWGWPTGLVVGLGLALAGCGSSSSVATVTPSVTPVVATPTPVDPKVTYKASAKTIPYLQLSNYPVTLNDTVVTYVGLVAQYDSATTTANMRVNVIAQPDFFQEIVWLDVNASDATGMNNGTWVQFWGAVVGSYSYTSGSTQFTIPEVNVKYLELAPAPAAEDVAAYKAGAQTVAYADLVAGETAKTTNSLSGTVVSYVGQIVQYDSATTTSGMRVDVGGKAASSVAQIVWLQVNPSDTQGMVNGTWVHFWGGVAGDYTYTTTGGGQVTLPEVLVRRGYIEATVAPA
jgi:hypothetical protein